MEITTGNAAITSIRALREMLRRRLREKVLYLLSSLFIIRCTLWAVLIFMFGNKVQIHTPFRNERPRDSRRGVGSLSVQPHNGGSHTVAHAPPRRPLSARGSTAPGPVAPPPAALGGAAPGRRFPRWRFPSSFAGEPENPERTGPARRRMLSSEQVQFASRKLERYTGVGGGRGGISGQPDSPATTSGLSLPR